MHLLIVDDEPKARQTLIHILQLCCPQVQSIAEASAVQEALEKIEKRPPDVLLLDIQLGNESGFDLLNALEGQPLNVIFVTAYNEYAVKAFKLAAIDYLLKPVNSKDLMNAIQRAQDQLETRLLKTRLSLVVQQLTEQQQVPDRIVLKTAESIHLVEINTIVCCEASKNYTIFYLNNKEKILVSKHLSAYENILPSGHFLRSHKSYLINTQHIIRYDKRESTLELVNGQRVPVSVRRRELLINYFNQYE